MILVYKPLLNNLFFMMRGDVEPETNSVVTVSGISPNNWYKIKVERQFSNGYLNMYINDILVDSSIDMSGEISLIEGTSHYLGASCMALDVLNLLRCNIQV